ncbi:MAG: hypothetical protein Q4B86_07955 [Eubacteriales bacterium]|nr:hypothetical protein [Eubacteriales bacterium]
MLFITLFTVIAGMSITAAFFSDVIDQKILIKTADLSLNLPENSPNNTGKDMKVSADLNELDNKIDPIKQNDEFNFNFRTVYKGSTDAYIVPKLILKIKNIKEGDKLAVYRENAEGRKLLKNIVFNGNGQISEEIFLKSELCKPGEEKKYKFIIKIEESKDVNLAPSILIIPEMQFAITQIKGNEWTIEDSSDPTKVFEQIKNKAEEKDSEVKGFSEIIGSDKTVDQNGNCIAGKKAYFIRIKPVIKDAEGDTSDVIFYRKMNNKDKKLKADEDGALSLCLNSSNLNTEIRYTVKNKAGTISSPFFVFLEKAGKLVCKKIIQDS